jgi:hypothetical protein
LAISFQGQSESNAALAAMGYTRREFRECIFSWSHDLYASDESNNISQAAMVEAADRKTTLGADKLAELYISGKVAKDPGVVAVWFKAATAGNVQAQRRLADLCVEGRVFHATARCDA